MLYTRAARLFDELQVAHGDGSFARRLTQLAKLDLLVIDDFAISPMGAAERNDLLEVLDDRIGNRSTLITSQLPVKAWHTYLDDPTLADAILDRACTAATRSSSKANRCAKQPKTNDPRAPPSQRPTRLTHRVVRSSQATPAAVDKSAPHTFDERFATARFRLIVDD